MRTITITSSEITDAFEPLGIIGATVRYVLEKTPPSSRRILSTADGHWLGAQLRISTASYRETGYPVMWRKPMLCTAPGLAGPEYLP